MAMDWKVEKEEKIETLISWIEATAEEIEFAEILCKILKKSSSKEEFIKMAKNRLQQYQNPWLQKEFNAFLNFVI